MIYPVRKTLKVFGDDSFELSLTWKDSDGNIIDLTTCTAIMDFFLSEAVQTQVKRIVGDNTPMPDPADSQIVLSATAPNVYCFIKFGETGIGSLPDFTQEPGFYKLHIYFDASTSDRLMEGKIRYEL